MPPIISVLTGMSPATHDLMTREDYAAWKEMPFWKNRRTALHVLADAGFLVDGELVKRWEPVGFTRDTDGDAIIQYFEENRDKRWVFVAGPYSTHLPYNPPQKYYEEFVDSGFHPDEAAKKRMNVVKTCIICHPSDVISITESWQKDTIGEGARGHKRGMGRRRSKVGVVDLQPEDEPGVRALYDGALRVLDDLVGAWVAKLESLDLLDETMIVVVADHGEELLDRGYVGHTSCNLKGTLYDECVRIPLIIRYPKAIPAGTVVKNQISQIDIMPTIFDILGMEMPPPVDGLSMLPLIRGEATTFREEAYAEAPPAGWQRLADDRRRIWCVRTLDWKLILHTDPAKNEKRYELFNMREDPGEKNDIIEQEADRADELKAKLDAYTAKTESDK